MKSKFSECPDFSCSRSDGTLEPVTSSFPAESESLRASSQSSAVVKPVRPLTRSFSPVRVQSGKPVVTQVPLCELAIFASKFSRRDPTLVSATSFTNSDEFEFLLQVPVSQNASCELFVGQVPATSPFV